MVLRCQPPEFHALVADDDDIVRRMVSFALTQEGFVCDTAVDGAEANIRLSKSRYDLVVTDLQMPNKNGHALSIDLLADKSRPVIIVHTSVEEPRIMRDLILRGVDDVIHKPTNYETFAIKARCLAKRRRARHEEAGSHTAAESSDTKSESESDGVQRSRIPISEVEKRLTEVCDLFPLSHIAFDVYSLAMQQDAEGDALAKAIKQDAGLTAEVLKLANSSYSNRGGFEVDSVDKAIVGLGRRRIGELALAVGGRQALAGADVPWIDREPLWTRSLAAANSLPEIESNSGSTSDQGSHFLGALLHPMGRIVLASLFPMEHQELVERCRTTGESLDVAEEETFGMNSRQVVARLITAWRLPADCRLPAANEQHREALR